jgi:hypothetical protein
MISSGPLAGGHLQSEQREMQVWCSIVIVLMLVLVLEKPTKQNDHEHEHEHDYEKSRIARRLCFSARSL